MAIWVGTSGYNYPEWKGSFYPEKLPAAKMLPYYAERLSTVEINYTYQPLVSEKFLGDRTIQAIASFTVRDDRDLTQIYQRDSGDPDDIQTCSEFRGKMGIATDGSFTS